MIDKLLVIGAYAILAILLLFFCFYITRKK
jgi:hypothetical protein